MGDREKEEGTPPSHRVGLPRGDGGAHGEGRELLPGALQQGEEFPAWWCAGRLWVCDTWLERESLMGLYIHLHNSKCIPIDRHISLYVYLCSHAPSGESGR